MRFRFLLNDVSIRLVDKSKVVVKTTFQDAHVRLNEKEYYLNVPSLAQFYFSDPSEIEICLEGNPEKQAVELYLNGSILGAVLHRRHKLPLHGSSFIYKGKTIVICGDSGSGKSTTTAYLCNKGATFLTDDITPIIVDENIYVDPISDSIKLWGDSVKSLGFDLKQAKPIKKGIDKYFIHLNTSSAKLSKIDLLLILTKTERKETNMTLIDGTNKFEAIHAQIYRAEYLKGLANVQQAYFENLIQICQKIPFYQVSRPSLDKSNQFLSNIEMLINEKL